MVRIKDVAEAVGVSTATVSNVINGKEQRVSKEVREKIQTALVDEYQDTNHMQYLLTSLLAAGRKRSRQRRLVEK